MHLLIPMIVFLRFRWCDVLCRACSYFICHSHAWGCLNRDLKDWGFPRSPCHSERFPCHSERSEESPLRSRKGVRGMLAATLTLWGVDGVGVDFALLGESYVHHGPVGPNACDSCGFARYIAHGAVVF